MNIPKLTQCARCGEDHGELTFQPLTRPVLAPVTKQVEVTHWCPCPTNGEPILLCCTVPGDEGK